MSQLEVDDLVVLTYHHKLYRGRIISLFEDKTKAVVLIKPNIRVLKNTYSLRKIDND